MDKERQVLRPAAASDRTARPWKNKERKMTKKKRKQHHSSDDDDESDGGPGGSTKGDAKPAWDFSRYADQPRCDTTRAACNIDEKMKRKRKACSTNKNRRWRRRRTRWKKKKSQEEEDHKTKKATQKLDNGV